jgi:beta-lactamase regulating signal transducer with metallopeptidase domain
VDELFRTGVSNAVAATVLAVLAAIVGRVIRRPALTHAVWLLVLVKLVTPPLRVVEFEWPSSEPARTAAVAASLPEERAVRIQPEPEFGAALEDGEIAVPEFGLSEPLPLPLDIRSAPAKTPNRHELPSMPGFSWTSLLAACWLAGSAAWLLLVAFRTHRFQSVLREARPAPQELRAEVRRLGHRLGLRQCPSVWLAPGRVSPMLWWLGGRARLYLPANLWPALDADKRTALLLHELAHLRRGDPWVRALEVVTTALYWWHPVVWWARHELREAEEQCCDAWVVWAMPGAARTYALALVETLDFLSEARAPLPAAASGMGRTTDLRRRLTMIMRGTTPRKLGWTGLLAVAGAAALLLPFVPGWAHAQPPAPGSAPQDRRPDGGDEQSQRAQAELSRAEAELARARQQLEEAERRLQDMHQRLGRRQTQAGAGERPDGGPRRRMVVVIQDENGREIGRMEVQPGQQIRVPGGPPDGDRARNPMRPGGNDPAPGEARPGRGRNFDPNKMQPPGQPGAPPGATGPGPGGPGAGGRFGGPGTRPGGPSPEMSGGPGAGENQERRLQQMERRLDEVMRVLEQMRREMQERRPGQRGPAGSRRELPEGEDSIKPIERKPPT